MEKGPSAPTGGGLGEERRFLVDVGLQDLPFPMRATSKASPEGQPTVANISVSACIMQSFEARWIDRFIQTLHRHRDSLNAQTLKESLTDYLDVLKAATVKINCDFPFFVEKQTPVSKQKCLVRYACALGATASTLGDSARVVFTMEIPCITTYPISELEHPGGLFGQLSVLRLEVESAREIFPEDLVALVDRHAVAPVYSFLEQEDQIALIDTIHSKKKTSVVLVDDVKTELARDRDIHWYAVRSSNYGMLHSYSTIIRTHKSSWVPFSGHDDEI